MLSMPSKLRRKMIFMLSRDEAGKLLTVISHIDGRPVSAESAIAFCASINAALPLVTLNQCLRAVSRFHSTQHDFSRIMPGDVVTLIRKSERVTEISDWQVQRALLSAGLTGDALCNAYAPKMLRGLLARGVSWQDAITRTAQRFQGFQLPQQPSKAKQIRPAGRFKGTRSQAKNAKTGSGTLEKQ